MIFPMPLRSVADGRMRLSHGMYEIKSNRRETSVKTEKFSTMGSLSSRVFKKS